jgi:hypothetical protein
LPKSPSMQSGPIHGFHSRSCLMSMS